MIEVHAHMCEMSGCIPGFPIGRKRPAIVVHWVVGHKREYHWCADCADVVLGSKVHKVVVALPIWQPRDVDNDQLLAVELICHGISRLCSPRDR